MWRALSGTNDALFSVAADNAATLADPNAYDLAALNEPQRKALIRFWEQWQEALKTLSARYGFTPKGPILVEIFPVHDDFAVRNLGLPGMIGALGAFSGLGGSSLACSSQRAGRVRLAAWLG